MMDMERIEGVIISAARLYRELNKPILRSRIDMTHDVYADEEAEEPALTVSVKGEPKVKLLDLLIVGSAIMIFVSTVANLLGWLRRR